MRITASKVSTWAGIIGILPAIGWYVSSVQDFVESLRASSGSHWPSIFGGAAVLCIVIMLLANAGAHSRWERLFTRQSSRPEAGTPSASEAQFKNVDEFYKTYSSRMLNETEELVKKGSDEYKPGLEREKYLTRIAAMLTTLLIFERTWLTIYGSQLKLLQDLNIDGVKTHEQTRSYYDQAVKAYPDYYKSVSFDAWIGYLKTWLLIRDYDATHVEITIRGQDFLRYLLEARYDPAVRLG